MSTSTPSHAPQARTTELRVARGSGSTTHFDTFTVPYEDGMSVLDGLRWIRETVDSTLAVRFSCVNANVCRTCMARVDGEVKYLCTARLTSAPTTIEPLATRRIIRDLVTDTVPADEHLPGVATPPRTTD